MKGSILLGLRRYNCHGSIHFHPPHNYFYQRLLMIARWTEGLKTLQTTTSKETMIPESVTIGPKCDCYKNKLLLFCQFNGNCGMPGCTCNSLHISPGFLGEEDEWPILQKEEVVNWLNKDDFVATLGWGKGPTKFVYFGGHVSSNMCRYLSDTFEGRIDQSLVKILLRHLLG